MFAIVNEQKFDRKWKFEVILAHFQFAYGKLVHAIITAKNAYELDLRVLHVIRNIFSENAFFHALLIKTQLIGPNQAGTFLDSF